MIMACECDCDIVGYFTFRFNARKARNKLEELWSSSHDKPVNIRSHE
jgi:hypothetical protein